MAGAAAAAAHAARQVKREEKALRKAEKKREKQTFRDDNPLTDQDIQDIREAKEAKLEQEAIEQEQYEANLDFRGKVKLKYNSTPIQILVASLIGMNFVVNAVEKQIMNPSPPVLEVLQACELFFNTAFTIELVANMYAHWFKEFWSSSWNWFDFVVVAISLMSMALSGLPGISTLRLMRAFRVFRLFKRLQSLRRIIKALEAAIPGCMNAFSILLLVSSIYSILGVEFFSEIQPYYFQNFTSAFYTLFQVMTGDSWAEMVARPIVNDYPIAAVFFVSYILFTTIILMNVVVAVLLEKMADQDVEEEEGEERGENYSSSETESESESDTEEGAKGGPGNDNLDTLEDSTLPEWQRMVHKERDKWIEKASRLKELSKTILAEQKSTIKRNSMIMVKRTKDTETAKTVIEDEVQVEREPLSWELIKSQASVFYNTDKIQIGVAILIFLNFVQNAIEAQVPEPGNELLFGFAFCELFFTVAFGLELVLNMVANWFVPFWQSGWNIFDFVVVMVGLLSMVLSGLPGVSTLRLMRAFRVFRLFKRLQSLRIIIKALEDAIPGCMNAFTILILVTAIYAILGVEFFSDLHPYYFINFSASFFAMFQVMTGDSWSEAIARPVIDVYPHAALFFISYMLIAGVMLMNVVIAVLLEKMATVSEQNDSDMAQDKAEAAIDAANEGGDVNNAQMPVTMKEQIRFGILRSEVHALKESMDEHMRCIENILADSDPKGSIVKMQVARSLKSDGQLMQSEQFLGKEIFGNSG